mmetsp:Transcript_3447/g.9811  ORF Transcript_3447/g.9811 Transcript_3447/m.9811 type:complete len:677 (-) Transcript_3447:193-2223(-)
MMATTTTTLSSRRNATSAALGVCGSNDKESTNATTNSIMNNGPYHRSNKNNSSQAPSVICPCLELPSHSHCGIGDHDNNDGDDDDAERKYLKHDRQQRYRQMKLCVFITTSILTFLVTWTYMSLTSSYASSRTRTAASAKHSSDTTFQPSHSADAQRAQTLKTELLQLEHDIINDVDGGIRPVRADMLLDLHGNGHNQASSHQQQQQQTTTSFWSFLWSSSTSNNRKQLFAKFDLHDPHNPFFHAKRTDNYRNSQQRPRFLTPSHHNLGNKNKPKQTMKWQQQATSTNNHNSNNTFVDYTKHEYTYPEIQEYSQVSSTYPQLRSLQDVFTDWPQNELDHPPPIIHETLMHFDYQNIQHRQMAIEYRKARVPFKMINVPNIQEVGDLWTDEYLIDQFDSAKPQHNTKQASGTAQESPNNFFAFFAPPKWDVEAMGIPPTRTNDWDFATWLQHAKYAQDVGLSPNRPHFYWQAGVDRVERYEREQTFITKDLAATFASTKANFFLFEPQHQKGIQCRFGERGIAAAVHYDVGRNMIGMIHGAKRYVLHPPTECQYLGIHTSRHDDPIFRHSLLNFGNLQSLSSSSSSGGSSSILSTKEQEWLQVACQAQTVETVLKAGEVLYLPSYWFHYIISLQRSTQCNVRNGPDVDADDGGNGSTHHRTKHRHGTSWDVRDGCVR